MMLQAVPPSLFFGKKTTRGQTKTETERVASPGNTAKVTTLKSNNQHVSLRKRDTGERQLRSAAKPTLQATSKIAITSPSDPPANNVRQLRARKNAKLEENPQKCPKTSSIASRVQLPSSKTATVKNVEIQPKDKNPVYKQATLELPSTGISTQDEYEFQVETPEGTMKKLKKRQPRLKKIQTLWGLKVRPETKKKVKPSSKFTIQEPENVKRVVKIQTNVALKDLVPLVKKTVTPLQARTGNTLCPMETAGVVSGQESHHDILVGNLDGKENVDQTTSENSNKCVQPKNKQTDEVKENIPLVRKKPPHSTGSKKIETPLKERPLIVHSNSTPLRSITSQAINNMSVNLSPIHVGGCANQSIKSTPRRKSIHASTPVQSKVFSNTSENNIPLSEICRNNQSKNQIFIPIPKFPQSTLLSNQEETPQHQNTQLKSASSSPHFDDAPLTSFENDASNDGGRLSMSSDPESPQQDSVHSRDKSLKVVPVPQAPSTWRLGTTVRYNFNINPNIDNCFGFDDDDTDLMNGIQPNQLIVPDWNVRQVEKKRHNQFHQRFHDLPVKKPCSQPEKGQVQKRPCNLSQMKITQLAKKPLNKKTVSIPASQTEQDKLPSCDSQDTAVPPEQNIDNLLSSSLSKLREKKKKAGDSFFGNIISEDLIVPTSSSQLTSKENEENTTNSEHLPTLFDDLEKDDFYRSPFSKPLRRSYACVRPMKRSANEEEDEEEAKKEKKTRAKRTKTVYKRKKMTQTSLLDQWAKELSSHFAEVDDTDLITE